MRNRLKYWRHQFQMERKEFAEYLGESYFQYTKWEANKVQPTTEKLYDIWKKIRQKFDNVNLQDLLDE